MTFIIQDLTTITTFNDKYRSVNGPAIRYLLMPNEHVKSTRSTMSYYYSRKIDLPFEDVFSRLVNNLQQQGFGVITTIDIKDTFKQKLNIEFRKYKIIGACNPQLAFKAISLESHIGLMLPCNLVVQEHENGEVEISAINPLDTIDRAVGTTQLTEVATEVGNRLRAAIDEFRKNTPDTKQEEVFPINT